MPIIKETTVHDMKTSFSKYAADLSDGTYDEVVVKNRTVPTLRVLPDSSGHEGGLEFGASAKRGHLVASDDGDINDGDAEIADMFGEALK